MGDGEEWAAEILRRKKLRKELLVGMEQAKMSAAVSNNLDDQSTPQKYVKHSVCTLLSTSKQCFAFSNKLQASESAHREFGIGNHLPQMNEFQLAGVAEEDILSANDLHFATH